MAFPGYLYLYFCICGSSNVDCSLPHQCFRFCFLKFTRHLFSLFQFTELYCTKGRFQFSIKEVQPEIWTSRLSISHGISCHVVEGERGDGLMRQWGSTLKVSNEVPAIFRHICHLTEKLFRATLKPNKTNKQTLNGGCLFIIEVWQMDKHDGLTPVVSPADVYKLYHTVFYLTTTHTPISAQSSHSMVFKL